MRRALICSLLTAWLIGCVSGAGHLEEGTMVMAIESSPTTFDPRGLTPSDTARIHQLLYHTLVQKNERFEIVPELAERWDIDRSSRTFTFHLRRGVKFHDGKELTGEDVAYTFNSLIAPDFDSPKRAAFSRLQRVELLEPYTVVFHCRESYPGLLVDVMAVGIIPAGTGSSVDEHPVGTGPFRFVHYTESQQLDLEGFSEAFRGAPRIKRLRIRIIRDATTLSLELLSGAVHFALNTRLSPDFIEEQRRLGTLDVIVSDGAPVEYLVLNTMDPALSDLLVRQAIDIGINRDVIIDNLLQRQARPARAVLPRTHWAYNHQLPPNRYDPDQARELLGKAGFPDPDGEGPEPRLKLVLKTSSAEQPREIATIIQEQLRLIGIAIELQSLEFQTYVNDLNRGQFQMGFLRLVGGYFPDIFKAAYGSRSVPYDPLVQERDRTGFLNRARYRNQELDRLAARAELLTDRQEQAAIYGRIQEILAGDRPWIYLWYPANVAVMSDRVSDVNIPPSGDYFFLKDVSFHADRNAH